MYVAELLTASEVDTGANGRMYISNLPDSLESYATQRPSRGDIGLRVDAHVQNDSAVLRPIRRCLVESQLAQPKPFPQTNPGFEKYYSTAATVIELESFRRAAITGRRVFRNRSHKTNLNRTWRYEMRCGATIVMNSRGVMILVFFQNFGKCR